MILKESNFVRHHHYYMNIRRWIVNRIYWSIFFQFVLFSLASTYGVGLQHMPSSTSPQHTTRSMVQPHSTTNSRDYYKHLTLELNKCFDDIESFVRSIEVTLGYTKELERDQQRKDKSHSEIDFGFFSFLKFYTHLFIICFFLIFLSVFRRFKTND